MRQIFHLKREKEKQNMGILDKVKKKYAKIIDQLDALNHRTEILCDKIEQQSKEIELLHKTIRKNSKKINALQKKSDEVYNSSIKSQEEIFKNKEEIYKNQEQLLKISQLQDNVYGIAQENNWAFVFNNTITQSDWLVDKNFSLGRWAIGYQCAYVIYRVLHQVEPKKILELGLGQSTKLISQYSNYYKDVHHTVVESDPQWIQFFNANYSFHKNMEILQCPYTFEDFQGHTGIRVFEGLDQKINGRKFDLIVIDAPLGGDMDEISRIDILKNIPQCLAKSFVIVFDDINRSADYNSFCAIQKVLDDSGIAYAVGSYQGQKITGVIVSDDLKFICSM